MQNRNLVFLALACCLMFIAIPTAKAQDCLDYSAYPSELWSDTTTSDPLQEIAVIDGAIYAAEGNNLVIYTWTDPEAPARIVTLDLGATVGNPCVSGDRFFLSVVDEGIRIYDITNRIAPTLLNTIPRSGSSSYQQILDIAVQGDLLVYTETSLDVRLMDVSDPLLPIELSTIPEVLTLIAIEGNQMVLTGGAMRLYDISVPALPIETAAITYQEMGCGWYHFSFAKPAFLDGIAYAQNKFACNWRNPYLYGDPIYPSYTLRSLSANKGEPVTEPTAEKILGGPSAAEVFRINDSLLIPGAPGYHALLDPVTSESGFFPLNESINDLVQFGGYVYTATETGLVICGEPGAYGPDYYLGATDGYVSNYQFDLQTAGDLLIQGETDLIEIEVGPDWWETYFNHGVRVWSNGSDLGRMRLPYDTDFIPVSWANIEILNDRIYMGSRFGLHTTAIGDLAAETFADAITIPDFTRLAVVGDLLYLADETNGLRILDPIDPLAPTDLGLALSSYVFTDMILDGNTLYLRDGPLLRRVDISNPETPTLLSGALIIPDGDLKISNDILFVISETAMSWYDLGSGFPILIGTHATTDPVEDVLVSGPGVYFTDKLGVGLIEWSTGQFIGRVMVRDAQQLAVLGEELMVTQRMQRDPLIVPADCADVVAIQPDDPEGPMIHPLPPIMRSEMTSVHPNPFNPQTEIRYHLREAGLATLAVYDLTGRRVAILADGPHAATEHRVSWQGRDREGRALPSGSYLLRLESASGVDNRKLLLLR